VAVRRLRDVGEHAWIAALARRLAVRRADRRILLGPGDDAAAIRPGRRPLLFTADALVENVHFRAGWAAPAALGRRAWAVSASDLAAMGGVPGLAVRRLAAGVAARLPDPPRRVRAGRLLARVASAMIDVSDGLLQDAGQLCRASRVGAEIDLGRLPIAGACRRALGRRAAAFAACAGEDYELVVAVPCAREPALRRMAPRLGCRITPVGRLLAGPPVVRVRD